MADFNCSVSVPIAAGDYATIIPSVMFSTFLNGDLKDYISDTPGFPDATNTTFGVTLV